MATISVVLITRNEELKLEKCLEALKWADEIIVVDNESMDYTREIASRFTDKIFVRKLDDFSSQKNYGIMKASGDWILSIDADEIVSPELRDSIQKVKKEGSVFDAFYIRRKNFIFGKFMRFGGQGIERLVRLFKKDRGLFEQPIHEKLIIRGAIGELAGELLHYGTTSNADYLSKLEQYTDFEANWLRKKGIRSRWIERWVKPIVRFVYFYVFCLGCLDGWRGLKFHMLSSYYYHLKYTKLKKIMVCERSGRSI